jgi:hypothetical protein
VRRGKECGVERVWMCKNSRVDGLVEVRVDDDQTMRLGLEIKYRMDWPKACQACAQIAWYQERVPLLGGDPIVGGLVVFEEFAQDWKKIPKKKRLLENGWGYWYTDHPHVHVNGQVLPLHLARYRADADVLTTQRIELAQAHAATAAPGSVLT